MSQLASMRIGDIKEEDISPENIRFAYVITLPTRLSIRKQWRCEFRESDFSVEFAFRNRRVRDSEDSEQNAFETTPTDAIIILRPDEIPSISDSWRNGIIQPFVTRFGPR